MSQSTLHLGIWEELGNTVPMAVIATDIEGVVRVWSPGAVALYGWSPEETLGRPIQEITVGPLERGVAQQIMDQVVRGEAWEGDFHARNRQGNVVEVHVVDLPIFDDDGQPSGIVGLSFALNQARMESPIQDVLGLARQIRDSRVRERTRLARVMHDEIGQLLAAARTESLANVDQTTNGAHAKVSEYLDHAIAQLRKEVAALLEAQIDVWEMILRCYELTREFQARAGVLVDCRINGPAEWFQEIGNDVSLTAFSVVRESLRNAERHAMPQHVEVTVEAHRNGVSVAVVDDGKGVGTIRPGMGLTILRDSVEQLDGRLEVRPINELGMTGTIVRAWIPTTGQGS